MDPRQNRDIEYYRVPFENAEKVEGVVYCSEIKIKEGLQTIPLTQYISDKLGKLYLSDNDKCEGPTKTYLHLKAIDIPNVKHEQPYFTLKNIKSDMKYLRLILKPVDKLSSVFEMVKDDKDSTNEILVSNPLFIPDLSRNPELFVVMVPVREVKRPEPKHAREFKIKITDCGTGALLDLIATPETLIGDIRKEIQESEKLSYFQIRGRGGWTTNDWDKVSSHLIVCTGYRDGGARKILHYRSYLSNDSKIRYDLYYHKLFGAYISENNSYQSLLTRFFSMNFLINFKHPENSNMGIEAAISHADTNIESLLNLALSINKDHSYYEKIVGLLQNYALNDFTVFIKSVKNTLERIERYKTTEPKYYESRNEKDIRLKEALGLKTATLNFLTNIAKIKIKSVTENAKELLKLSEQLKPLSEELAAEALYAAKQTKEFPSTALTNEELFLLDRGNAPCFHDRLWANKSRRIRIM